MYRMLLMVLDSGALGANPRSRNSSIKIGRTTRRLCRTAPTVRWLMTAKSVADQNLIS
jgi:hypothetical protein